jgi:hypothetical protein
MTATSMSRRFSATVGAHAKQASMLLRDGPVPYYQFGSLHNPSIRHGVFTRIGGASIGPFSSLNLSLTVGDEPRHVATNRARVAETLGFDPRRLITTPMVHGDDVVVVDDANADSVGSTRADIVVTAQPGRLIAQRFADCVPIILWTTTGEAVGVAHAGWRGTALSVAAKAAASVAAVGGVQVGDVHAAIGPSIGPCCYEVGPEVAVQFSSDHVSAASTLDLWSANQAQLVAAGVATEHIEVSRVCTRCHSATYFSHRAHGYPAGRFGVAIGIA